MMNLKCENTVIYHEAISVYYKRNDSKKKNGRDRISFNVTPRIWGSE